MLRYGVTLYREDGGTIVRLLLGAVYRLTAAQKRDANRTDVAQLEGSL